jgi:hypothetical protein
MDDKYLAKYEDTKWLVLSSFLFCIPSIYAFITELYFHSGLLLFTSLISANYWRKATYCWRRNLDLIFSKISFGVFVSNGIYYVREKYFYLGYLGLFLLIYCFFKSANLHNKAINSSETTNNWYKYHFFFHVLMTIELMIIIQSIITSK